MPTPIHVPKFGVAMTEGILAQWLQPDGARVNQGDPIFVLETEKVESEVEAPATGWLRHIREEGERYVVGARIGEIL